MRWTSGPRLPILASDGSDPLEMLGSGRTVTIEEEP